MPRRPNYGFQKRQKEIKRQNKKEEKAAKKKTRKEERAGDEANGVTPDTDDPASARARRSDAD